MLNSIEAMKDTGGVATKLDILQAQQTLDTAHNAYGAPKRSHFPSRRIPASII
jgi:hypothetical protein